MKTRRGCCGAVVRGGEGRPCGSVSGVWSVERGAGGGAPATGARAACYPVPRSRGRVAALPFHPTRSSRSYRSTEGGLAPPPSPLSSAPSDPLTRATPFALPTPRLSHSTLTHLRFSFVRQVDLAVKKNVLIGGDDFKSGQTKMKSVLVDFLVGAGIKPTSIVSYNHLGNNDGMNLSAPQTFRSKEISKSNVVDDMVSSNEILYGPGEHPDHVVVIKYVPYVSDSKRAMDEYTSEIFLGGRNTIVMHNTCEDSLLAAPIILDLVILAELLTRIEVKKDGEADYHNFHPVAVLLSYLTKAPLVPDGTPVVNALAKQRAMVENIFRACIGLNPDNNMMLEFKA